MPCLFVDNLTAIDCSILDPQRGLIGASWAVDVKLSGELDQQSMVFDFSRVKKTIKEFIDREVDHKLVVPASYPGLTISGHQDLTLKFVDRHQQQIVHRSPASAVCKIPKRQVKRQAVADFLEQNLPQFLPENVQKLEIRLRREKQSGHYYCYSHGLKKHDGNCQRIAHGHRSRIKIWQNGQRAEQLEKQLAGRWRDIYLGTVEDVVLQENGRIHFAYRTSEGEFFLDLPASRVHLMRCDSTVECIAEHIRNFMQADNPE
ncbi:MAG: 6-pyruvoyl tetrahydropterin reductase, partial [Gammaproteobacteria bacterium]|nr:6-pyruvoyl tetrahydropterin reductase [Gammaproteobacteria bacterium]